MLADPKNTVKMSAFFVLMGSVCVKDAHKMLVKLIPDRDVLVKPLHLAFYSADERS